VERSYEIFFSAITFGPSLATFPSSDVLLLGTEARNQSRMLATFSYLPIPSSSPLPPFPPPPLRRALPMFANWSRPSLASEAKWTAPALTAHGLSAHGCIATLY